MANAGVGLISGLDELAVMGFAEVLRRLPFFRRLERRLVRLLREDRPDLVLPIDYPGPQPQDRRALQGPGNPGPLLYRAAGLGLEGRARGASVSRSGSDRGHSSLRGTVLPAAWGAGRIRGPSPVGRRDPPRPGATGSQSRRGGRRTRSRPLPGIPRSGTATPCGTLHCHGPRTPEASSDPRRDREQGVHFCRARPTRRSRFRLPPTPRPSGLWRPPVW